jgi:hypothetical protein
MKQAEFSLDTISELPYIPGHMKKAGHYLIAGDRVHIMVPGGMIGGSPERENAPSKGLHGAARGGRVPGLFRSDGEVSRSIPWVVGSPQTSQRRVLQ